MILIFKQFPYWINFKDKIFHFFVLCNLNLLNFVLTLRKHFAVFSLLQFSLKDTFVHLRKIYFGFQCRSCGVGVVVSGDWGFPSLECPYLEFLPTYLYIVVNYLVLCQASIALTDFPTFLALYFPQLPDVLVSRLKFHINIEQSLKNSWMSFWIYPFIESSSHPPFCLFNTNLLSGTWLYLN